MEQSEVIRSLLLPSDQQTAGAIGPGVAAFDDPAAGFGVRGECLRLFAFARNMRLITASSDCLPNGFGVVALVCAEVLLAAARGTGATHSHVLKSLTHQRLIVSVGPRDGDSQRHPASIGQHRPLGTQLAPIGGVFACLFPPRAATL